MFWFGVLVVAMTGRVTSVSYLGVKDASNPSVHEIIRS